MDRITLALLEVSNGKLPTAAIPFQKGLNLISGAENRGKSYAWSCLDYLMGASDAPEKNPHSKDYTTATLYYTTTAEQRGAVRRGFATGDAEALPLHSVNGDIPTTGWTKLKKTHKAKSPSLSSYWVSAFGFTPNVLRGNMSGKMTALTVRFLAHLVLIDELRIMDKRSPARSAQATSWPPDMDALALVLGARLTPPRETAGKAEPEEPKLPPAVREFIERELARIDTQIEARSTAANKEIDESAEMTDRAKAFTEVSEAAATELRKILGEIENTQRDLAIARTKTKTSREISARLELLQKYYESDLKRLDAVSETTFLLEQLNSVPCPLCEHPLFNAEPADEEEVSKDYLNQIQEAARVESRKIVGLKNDLAETLGRAQGEFVEARSSEQLLSERLERLYEAERAQSKRVEEAHSVLREIFAAIGDLAQRQSLKLRRAELAVQLADAGPDLAENPVVLTEDRTEFDSRSVTDFCEVVKNLLIAWKWNYTTGPLTVAFDQDSTDIVISGSERKTFGKAARALASSAFLIGIMDYCLSKNLPHPGFVALDSPLTTKKEKGGDSETDDQVSDEIIVAFFTHLAANYADRQVIIFDNKEPPSSLRGRINHIRFDDDVAAKRIGFFPG